MRVSRQHAKVCDIEKPMIFAGAETKHFSSVVRALHGCAKQIAFEAEFSEVGRAGAVGRPA
jgi:hypothetical protein